MEKLADGLTKLSEDDLLHVVTMIHDNKSAETYTKNDVESKFSLLWSEARSCRISLLTVTDGEFHVDLYTLPDTLVKSLWEYVSSKTDV
jgi:transcription initiation factor IIF auxiliary subunit